ncbi:MAG: GDSL-type esterase/lipase family protein [Rhodothermales bacterium]
MTPVLRKSIFTIAAVLLPVVLLVTLEGMARMAGVAKETRSATKAIENEPGWTGFNPEYGSRYFRGFLPAVAFNPFLQEPPDSLFRVVVLGGSSAAGFPYQWYDGFPAALERRLASRATGQPLEVINLGMTAVNSYTLWDLSRHVVDLQPDAVVIYAGHNEFYGAFGVGNTAEWMPKGVWFGRMQLWLKRSALYNGLERLLLGPPDYGLSPAANERTMMARVVRNAAITLDGPDYEAGVRQFARNMADVLDTFHDTGIPVIAGTLVANLSGQPPLSRDAEALAVFRAGAEAEVRGDTAEARRQYTLARDLDGIRFRAPSAVNAEIRSWRDRPGVTVVDLEPVFNARATSGIPGYDLFTDHLHPTLEGYRMMADAFADAVDDVPGFRRNPVDIPWPASRRTDALSQAQAEILIERLLADYPFQPESSADVSGERYARLISARRSSGRLGDSLAVAVLTQGLPTQQGLYDGVQLALARGDTLEALWFYRSLFHWQSFNASLMQDGVSAGLSNPVLDPVVEELALFGAGRTDDAYFWNALAVTQLRQGRHASARTALAETQRVEPDNPVLYYNLARLELAAGDTLAARLAFERYRTLVE